MNAPLVLIDNEHPGITILTLNRPEKRNALNYALMKELYEALNKVQNDTSQRVLILKGSGDSFCTGLDLNEALKSDLIKESLQLLKLIFSMLYTFPLVTIALVQGGALAGGAGLMSVCDLIIAAEGTKFGFPETRRGLVASLVMTFVHRQISERDARELFLFGETISTERALQIGLINRIVPQVSLQEEGLKFAKSAIKGAPMASCETKRFLGSLYPSSFIENLKVAEAFHLQARSSEEAEEGIQAFLEKRDPLWINSGKCSK